jgi:hypothetical protein
MYQDFCAWRRKRSPVVIEGSIRLSLRGKSWIYARRAHEIQRLGALADQAAPQMHRKGGVEAGEPGHKMIFPNADGPFGSISVMIVRRDELVGYVVLSNELLVEYVGTLVVQFLELWLEASVGEMLMDASVSTKKFSFGTIFDRFS